MTRRWLLLAFVAGNLVSLLVLPKLWRSDPEAELALARSVSRRLLAHPDRLFYRTGNARFDGQSAIAIHQMAILGLAQLVLERPDTKGELLPAMRSGADRLVDPQTLTYAASVYGQHGVVGMKPGQGHAYLGYVNLALGALRLVDPKTPHAKLHDRLSRELGTRLFESPTGMIETYPGETWPPDVAAVAGSVGLHARITGGDRGPLDAWAARFAGCAIHSSGYLVQRLKSGTCEPLDAPRGSGTAVAAYFLSFSHPELSRRLHDALLERSLLGFGGIREYAPGFSGDGDVNAGPIVLGVSVGASGFAIGAARANGDEELGRELYRTAYLFGLPADRGDERTFAAGGMLGNALLLAMLTARPHS